MYLTRIPLKQELRDVEINGYLTSKALLIDRMQYFTNIFELEDVDILNISFSEECMFLIQYLHGDVELKIKNDELTLKLIEAALYLFCSSPFINYLIGKLQFTLPLENYSRDIVRETKYLGNEQKLIKSLKLDLKEYNRLSPTLSFYISYKISKTPKFDTKGIYNTITYQNDLEFKRYCFYETVIPSRIYEYEGLYYKLKEDINVKYYYRSILESICHKDVDIVENISEETVIFHHSPPEIHYQSSIPTSLNGKFLLEDEKIFFSLIKPTQVLISDLLTGNIEGLKSHNYECLEAISDPKLVSIIANDPYSFHSHFEFEEYINTTYNDEDDNYMDYGDHLEEFIRCQEQEEENKFKNEDDYEHLEQNEEF
jgi:hypothetical protein